jgi:enoyl-CoA hydratase/carnithine racemase
VTIHLDIAGHVARVTIDRPAVLNALDAEATAALEAVWQQIEADRDIRAVVLTGVGERAFCAGADMRSDDAGGDGASGDERRADGGKEATNRTGLGYWAHAHPTGFGGLSLRTTLDIPVIARVNGHALGGGLEMVLGCDIVVAATHATFGLTEPRVGRLPVDGGMVLLPRRIGHRAAMGMLLTGRRITAAEALANGLVNEVVPPHELDSAVDRWLADILACAPLSLRAIKQTVRRTAQLTPQDAQALRLPAVIECLESQDGEEGVRAFLERRPPVWSGR